MRSGFDLFSHGSYCLEYGFEVEFREKLKRRLIIPIVLGKFSIKIYNFYYIITTVKGDIYRVSLKDAGQMLPQITET